jgi:hypothetical protein
MAMRDDGEPISRGQLDRRAADMRALRDSLLLAAFFGGVVLINGILAILLIGFLQSIGWWEVPPATGGEGAAALSGRFCPWSNETVSSGISNAFASTDIYRVWVALRDSGQRADWRGTRSQDPAALAEAITGREIAQAATQGRTALSLG